MSDPRSDLREAAFRELGQLDRRGFLRLAGIAAGAGLVPTGCGSSPPELAPPDARALVHLTPRSYAVLNAAAARVAGPRAHALVWRRAIDPAAETEQTLAAAPTLATALRQALGVLEFGVWPLLAKLRPFTALTPTAQDAVLDELRGSRLAFKRQLFGGVRAVGLLGVYTAIGRVRPPAHPIGLLPSGAAIADAMRPLEGPGFPPAPPAATPD